MDNLRIDWMLFLCGNSDDIFIQGATSLERAMVPIHRVHNSSRSYSLVRKTESMGRRPCVRSDCRLIIMTRIISGIAVSSYRCTRSWIRRSGHIQRRTVIEKKSFCR